LPSFLSFAFIYYDKNTLCEYILYIVSTTFFLQTTSLTTHYLSEE
jgi:hypothetical protein